MAGAAAKAGMTAAIEATGPGEPPELAWPMQLTLLPSLRTAPAGDIDRQEGQVSGGERGRGRPPGSRNRATQEMVDYLAAKGYGMPLERLAQIYSADPVLLAAELGLTRGDAIDLICKAASAALPYVHRKQPVAVDMQGKGMLQLVIGDVGQAPIDAADDHGLSVVLDAIAAATETPEISPFSDGDEAQSDDGQSDGEAK